MRRLIVAITGASGAIYGVQLLRRLRDVPDIETHLLLSAAGVLNVHQELDLKRGDVEALAHAVHNVNDIGASVASGSFATAGMVVAPCSMKTLGAIANGLAAIPTCSRMQLEVVRWMVGRGRVLSWRDLITCSWDVIQYIITVQDMPVFNNTHWIRVRDPNVLIWLNDIAPPDDPYSARLSLFDTVYSIGYRPTAATYEHAVRNAHIGRMKWFLSKDKFDIDPTKSAYPDRIRKHFKTMCV